MVVIITTHAANYAETMEKHQQKLNNFEAYGRAQTNEEMALQTQNIPEPQAMEIHGIYPTIYNYGQMIMYTTIVCFEPKSKEEEAEEAGESHMPEVRIS